MFVFLSSKGVLRWLSKSVRAAPQIPQRLRLLPSFCSATSMQLLPLKIASCSKMAVGAPAIKSSFQGRSGANWGEEERQYIKERTFSCNTSCKGRQEMFWVENLTTWNKSGFCWKRRHGECILGMKPAASAKGRGVEGKRGGDILKGGYATPLLGIVTEVLKNI